MTFKSLKNVDSLDFRCLLSDCTYTDIDSYRQSNQIMLMDSAWLLPSICRN